MDAKDYMVTVYEAVKDISAKDICEKSSDELVDMVLSKTLDKLSWITRKAANVAISNWPEWTNQIKAEVASQITKLQRENALFKDTLCPNKDKQEPINPYSGASILVFI
jgi:hypothetical protein